MKAAAFTLGMLVVAASRQRRPAGSRSELTDSAYESLASMIKGGPAGLRQALEILQDSQLPVSRTRLVRAMYPQWEAFAGDPSFAFGPIAPEGLACVTREWKKIEYQGANRGKRSSTPYGYRAAEFLWTLDLDPLGFDHGEPPYSAYGEIRSDPTTLRRADGFDPYADELSTNLDWGLVGPGAYFRVSDHLTKDYWVAWKRVDIWRGAMAGSDRGVLHWTEALKPEACPLIEGARVVSDITTEGETTWETLPMECAQWASHVAGAITRHALEEPRYSADKLTPYQALLTALVRHNFTRVIRAPPNMTLAELHNAAQKINWVA